MDLLDEIATERSPRRGLNLVILYLHKMRVERFGLLEEKAGEVVVAANAEPLQRMPCALEGVKARLRAMVGTAEEPGGRIVGDVRLLINNAPLRLEVRESEDGQRLDGRLVMEDSSE